jgi:hypothetical protein
MRDEFFRKLNEIEEKKYREYAIKNDPPDINNWYIYHPICREEWIKRGINPPQKEEGIS